MHFEQIQKRNMRKLVMLIEIIQTMYDSNMCEKASISA
ncbi:hypothetical protein [Acinetobacter bereziniae]|nr:hypothetical protein [Acinetobacter bereziniae]